MPYYNYECQSCNHTFELLLKISEKDKPLQENCEICGRMEIIKICDSPMICDPVRIGVIKPPKDVTKRIEKIKNDAELKGIDSAIKKVKETKKRLEGEKKL